jgi:hypothetical protein
MRTKAMAFNWSWLRDFVSPKNIKTLNDFLSRAASKINSALLKTGDKMSGDLNINGNALINHHVITTSNGNVLTAYPEGISYSKIDASNITQATGENFPANGTMFNLFHEDYRNAFMLFDTNGYVWYRRNYAAVWSDWSLLYSDSGWKSPTLLNGWQNYGGVFARARYRKIGNAVYIEGLVKAGTVGVPIARLDVGYRPSNTLIFSQVSNTGFARVDIANDGYIYLTSGGTGYLSLSGISFLVD